MKALRPRRIYWRPADRYVGFGRVVPDQPDLLETEFRLGWRILVICKVCLLTETSRLRAEIDHLKRLAAAAGRNISDVIAVAERQIKDRDGAGK